MMDMANRQVKRDKDQLIQQYGEKPMEDTPDGVEGKWYYHGFDKKDKGPFPVAKMWEWHRKGTLNLLNRESMWE
jgi:hypothetical protein